MTWPKFGQRVMVNAVLKRRSRRQQTEMLRQWETVKEWIEEAIEPRDGIYIGRRTLSNGVNEYLGEDQGVCFYPRAHFVAALVVFGEHTRPRLAMPIAVNCIQEDKE